jgi:hypothetical protein
MIIENKLQDNGIHRNSLAMTLYHQKRKKETFLEYYMSDEVVKTRSSAGEASNRRRSSFNSG